MFDDNNTNVPDVKKTKSINKRFIITRNNEMKRSCIYTALDQIISRLNIRNLI